MNGQGQTQDNDKIDASDRILHYLFTEGKIDWEKLKAYLGKNINFRNER